LYNIKDCHDTKQKVNADMIAENREYICDNDASERHQNNALKAVIAYTKFLGENKTFYDILIQKNR
jgi:hypothetical protein